jgi:chaperone BCS1
MDKTVLLTLILGGTLVYFKQFFLFVITTLRDRVICSMKIEESSFFFYSFQNFVLSEKNSSIKNLYYRTLYDNFISSDNFDVNMFYNSGFIYFKFNGNRFLVLKNAESIQNSMTPYKNNKHMFMIFCRNKTILKELMDYVDNNYGNKYIKYFYNFNGEIRCAGKVINKTFDNIYLDNNVSEFLKNDLDRFNSSKEKYDNYGIRYKRTYLFYGPPGTGKSSLSLGISNYTKRDIMAVNLSKDMTDANLIALISDRPKKSIVLFEDIDCLLDDINRKDEKKESDVKISLSCILNILDGIYTPNDVIFIITTNELEKIDDAIKRKGRTDVLMEIQKPSENLIEDLKTRFNLQTDKTFNNISELHEELLNL